MVAKRFDNVKIEIQAKTGRTWDQIQDMRSRVNAKLSLELFASLRSVILSEFYVDQFLVSFAASDIFFIF